MPASSPLTFHGLMPAGSFALLLSTQPLGSQCSGSLLFSPHQTYAIGTNHPPFIDEETEEQKGHVTPGSQGPQEQEPGLRTGAVSAPPPQTEVQSSLLTSSALLHPLS